MSATTTPVTRQRVADALHEGGLLPFLGGEDQVAAIVGARVVRVVLPAGRPVQGIAEWSRSIDISHSTKASEVVARFNATTYLPKMTTAVSDEGAIRFRLQHTFSWGPGASDAQVGSEVLQFVMASMAAMNRLDTEFPDPWAGKEGPDE